MKIRAVTLGVSLHHDTFCSHDGARMQPEGGTPSTGTGADESTVDKDTSSSPSTQDTHPLATILTEARSILDCVSESLTSQGYEVQTLRIVFNSIEEWSTLETLTDRLELVKTQLERVGIEFCSLGGCKSIAYIKQIPQMLTLSPKFSCSARFDRTSTSSDGSVAVAVCPSYEYCLAAANASLDLFAKCGDLGNFRFCASFNCKPGIPFFPAAYHCDSDFDVVTTTNDSDDSNVETHKQKRSSVFKVSIGLENGDLLFLAFFGAQSPEEGQRNLREVMQQVLLPIQSIVATACTAYISPFDSSAEYLGIDASLNPGLALPDSVGAGLECLFKLGNHVFLPGSPTPSVRFGDWGTLGTVSAVTSAIKSLAPTIQLTGYSGLMLPVMEDVIMAQRVIESSSLERNTSNTTVGLRDLLVFSSVCGVGLDTIPVPGNVTAEQLAMVYLETGTLAFRLDKPLSCRLLPMAGKKAGDLTDVDSPYLCNTTVFRLP